VALIELNAQEDEMICYKRFKKQKKESKKVTKFKNKIK
jgi:hypothetical protein